MGSNTYQIMHKEYGAFQGEWNGFSFWNMLSLSPELGVKEFESKNEAKDYIRVLCSISRNLSELDLEVAPFDEKLSRKMRIHGVYPVGRGNA